MTDLTQENLARNRRIVPNEAVDWDDRKTLREVFQDAAEGRVTIEGDLSHEYSALLAVARWGARQAVELLTIEADHRRAQFDEAQRRASAVQW